MYDLSVALMTYLTDSHFPGRKCGYWTRVYSFDLSATALTGAWGPQLPV